ncbi:hypothetical protein V1291_001910 [Nitrobacteraceae bacterium AZCC 1564]
MRRERIKQRLSFMKLIAFASNIQPERFRAEPKLLQRHVQLRVLSPAVSREAHLIIKRETLEQCLDIGFQLGSIFIAYVVCVLRGLHRHNHALHVVDHPGCCELF